MRFLRARRFGYVILLVFPFGVFLFLLWMQVVPTGVFVVDQVAGESSVFLEPLLPKERATPPAPDTTPGASEGEMVQAVIDDPPFFFAHPHRSFDRVDVEVWFQNNALPFVEIGLLSDTQTLAYTLEPLHNRLVETIPWPSLRDEEEILFQREPRATSLDAFLANPPAVQTIATYRATLSTPFRLSGTTTLPQSRIRSVFLRGGHTMFTYVRDEPLEMTWTFRDTNLREGADAVSLTVFDEQGAPVASTASPDDGISSVSGISSDPRTLTVSTDRLPEGPYRLELSASDDIIFETMTSKQKHLVFAYTLDLAALPQPVTLWTNAKTLRAETQTASGVQTLGYGQTSVDIAEPLVPVVTHVEETGLLPLTIPAGGISLFGEGNFAFTQDEFFVPEPQRFFADTNLDASGIDAVLAAASPAQMDGPWLHASATFEAAQAAVIPDGTWWKFVISAPGAKEYPGALRIHRIRLTWHRPSLLQELKRLFSL